MIKNEPFTAKSENAESFYLWLDRVFFRENSISPTGPIICSEFGVNSPQFTKSVEGLSEVFVRARSMKEVQVAFNNWKKYLKYTYGDIEASEDLFITHSYLSAFTKILMGEVISSKRKTPFNIENIPSAIRGDFFYNLNIRNYVEKDFFYWINFSQFSDSLLRLWEPIFHLLKAYDFSKIDNDFLKDIYQGLVDPEDRHDLGEHYTPDWLCEKIVADAISKHSTQIPTIADITCGSGSFLRIAIQLLRLNFLKQKSPSLKDKKIFIQEITKSVIGFEIHPLACFIAKTNYMLALEDLIQDIDEPLYIPIFLCDSLLNSELDQQDMIERGKFSIFLDEKEYILPRIEALTDQRFDEIIDHIDKITHHYIKKNDLNDASIEKLLLQRLDKSLVEDTNDFDLLMSSFVELTKALHDKVLNHENTIWSFVIKNNFRPIVFTNYFDIVVGNPPWLTFKDIGSGPYRKELETLGLKRYKIAPKSGKLKTQMELSTIFLAHAVESYLKHKGFLYFVLPRSLFSSDQHSNFREQSYDVRMNIEEIWDLFLVNPLFRVPSCVVVTSNNKKIIKTKFGGKIFSGNLPSQNINLQKAAPFLMEKKETFSLIKMNDRTAFSTTKQSTLSGSDNYYQRLFKQGATILPRNYYFVDTLQDFQTKKVIEIKTSESAKKNSKKPYNKVNLTGHANTKCIFQTLLAENILPFYTLSPQIIHLPIAKTNNEWSYISASDALNRGMTDSSDYFSKIEKSFKRLSGNKMSLFERLNYHNGLTTQNPLEKYWVLYCTSGTNV